MKRSIFLLLVGIFTSLFIITIASADNCKDGEAMIDKAFANAPDEMTEQYIEMAIQQCPNNAGLYRRIAQYYEQWYKKELNANNQKTYKKLAQDYYRQALKVDDGSESKGLKSELARLEDSNEFNEVAFRALRPSSQGTTGTGLKLDVHFDFNSYELTDTVQKHLDILGKILVEEETIIVSLEGHTDMTGSADYNKDLSVKRAEEVKGYLIKSYNISSDRIQTTGYGFERLADRNEPYSRINRRVEVLKIAE